MVKKVLIVDDEKSFLLSLRDGLSSHSEQFEIFTAENGKEAVEVLTSNAIDLLVTDLKLPVMDGFELLAWSSRHQPQLPVIVMSAFGTPEIEQRLASMDTLEFLDKPLDLETLERGIIKGLKARNTSFIRGISLATFLQLVKAEKKNCTLKVSSPDAPLPAYLYVRSGELIDADFGDVHGLEAALDVVCWDKTEIEMDGICRRQVDIIKLPIEHLLMDAFRLKDEQAEEEKQAGSVAGATLKTTAGGATEGKKEAPAKALSGSKEELKSVTELLQKLKDLQEFAVFDKEGRLLSSAPANCFLQQFDIKSLTGLLDNLAGEMGGKGRQRSMLLNSGARDRFLLFPCQHYNIVTRLKPGAQTHKVAADVAAKVA